jgi:hypothetical protein
MRGSSEPFDTDGSASCAPASVVPTAMEVVDDEAEEAAAELDATEEPLAGEETLLQRRLQHRLHHSVPSGILIVELSFICD